MMKTKEIFGMMRKRLHKEFSKNLNKCIDFQDSLNKSLKYEKHIRKILENYNFKGRNFKIEYLPVILAMAIEEGKSMQKNIKDKKY